MGQTRVWTEKEKTYLEENWGYKSIGALAKNLERTEKAVTIKAYKMGLGAFLDSGDYITWNQLMKALGYEKGMDTYKMTSWAKNRNFPLRTKKVRTTSFWIVKIDEFWEWAEKNKDLLDFSEFEKNVLGEEPNWVKQKRQHDLERNRKYIKTPWTKTEDEKLIFLLRQQKYTYDEISKKLCRTIGAIQVRMCDLEIKDRPIKASNQKWTEEKKQMLIDLIIQGYGYELIAEKIGRSSKAIRGLIYRMYGTENLDKVRNLLKEQLKK